MSFITSLALLQLELEHKIEDHNNGIILVQQYLLFPYLLADIQESLLVYLPSNPTSGRLHLKLELNFLRHIFHTCNLQNSLTCLKTQSVPLLVCNIFGSVPSPRNPCLSHLTNMHQPSVRRRHIQPWRS